MNLSTTKLLIFYKLKFQLLRNILYPLQRTILLTTPTSPLLPTIVRSRRAKRAEDGRGEGEGEETKQKDAVNPIYWWLVQVGSYIPSWAGYLYILLFWVILRENM